MKAWPRPVARALAWSATNRRVLVPAVFVVLVVANLVLLAALQPPTQRGTSLQIPLPSPDAAPDAGPDAVDTDGDGVADLDELYLYGTDPERSDTDGDGVPDVWESRHRRYDAIAGDYTPDPVVDDANRDPDHDGLTNLEEFLADTDPNRADTDGDALPDGWEVETGLDPKVSNVGKDTDGDGATDAEEFLRGTHPARLDSDLDGIPDAREAEIGTDASRYDTTGSGVADGWLVAFRLDPTDPESVYEDPDGDGLTVQDEFNWSAARFNYRQDLSEEAAAQNFRRGLDPTRLDTDGDGAGDGWEVRWGLDPLAPGDGGEDLDGDELTNLEEFAADSNPRAVDSDGDGLTDRDEAKVGWTIRLEEREFTVFSSPSRRDSDGDGLSDPEERQGFALRNGARVDFCATGACPLNPKNPDTDLDGLEDAQEILYAVTPRLNPLVADTDGDGLADGAEIRFWEERGRTLTPDEASRLVAERAAALGVRETPQAAREQVGPTGDADGDGVPNVVDPDSDGDKLPDGVEARPGRWRATPGSDLRFAFPATDPLFRDSDGDGLLDSWEKDNTRWHAECELWNLDPSRVNSFQPCAAVNDGKTDGERDLDDDGVRYESSAYLERRSFVFTNLLEQTAGTDPNDADTDNDRIFDGWEVFFTDLGRRLGVPLRLDPTEGSDANRTSKTLPYLRFEGTPSGAVEPGPNETILEVYSDIGLPQGGSQTVVKIAGEHAVTFLDEFLAGTDPASKDTDGDGLLDAWEFFWSLRGGYAPADATNPFSPVADTAEKDPDQDGLPNSREHEVVDAEGRAGLNPSAPDTDLGGITDDKELGELGPDGPLDPRNDNLNLDADGDGLTNGEEAFQYGTSPSLVDTDRDGLLDGGHVDLDLAKGAENARAKRFDALGILGRQLSNTVWRYYGEGKLGVADRTEPTKADTDADGLPDGWEAWYGLPARIYTAGATSDPDGLDDTTEYTLGRPSGWDPRKVWWFGGDPTNRDTDGDGLQDGAFDRFGRLTGPDLDYDNDGLNDLTGEDPYPVYDPANKGAVAVEDAAAAREWLGGGRLRTKDLDADGDRVPNGWDRAPAELRDLAVTFPRDAGILPKGSAVTVTGRLVAVTQGGEVAVPGAVVVANIDAASGDASRVLGVAVTGADGRFSLEAAARRDGSYTLPEGTSATTIFGRRYSGGETVTWSVNTSLLQPKATDRRIVLWNYGVAATEARYSFARVACSSVDAGFPIECSGSFRAEGLRSGFDRATDLGRPVKIKTETAIEIPAGGGVLRGENGGRVEGTGRLVDAAGDGVGGRAVTLTWRGANQILTTAADGTFPISLEAGTFDAPGLYDLPASFTGDGDRVYESSAVTGKVAIAFETRLTALVKNPNFVVAAGSALVVEGTLADYTGRPVSDGAVTVSFLSGAVTAKTGEDGAWKVEVPVPPDVLAGTQRVVVTYAGDEMHKASALERPIYVTVKQMTRFALDAGDHAITEPLVLEGALLDAANASVRDPTSREPLKVRITGPNFVTDAEVNANGVFVAVVDVGSLPGVGDYPVRFSFGGSPLFAPANEVFQWRLVSSSSFELPAQRLPRGGDGAVVGRLVDGRGDGIEAGAVDVTFGDLPLGTVVTNRTGWFRADVVLPPGAPLGAVRVKATYNGTSDGLIAPATPAFSTYHVVARTRLLLPDREVPTGEFVVNGSLVDDGGSAVGGEEIRITFDGVEVARARTDFEGAFETVVNPACLGGVEASACGSRVLARTYAVRATFAGSLVYAPAEAQASVRVLARTDIVLHPIDEIARGTDAKIRGRLLQEDGTPVPRATVIATLGGTERTVTIGRALTLPNGSFEIEGPIPPTFPRGPAPLRVAYAGDANRRAAEEIAVVEVVAPTRIQLVLPNRLETGDSFMAHVVLIDDEGKPVPDAIVRVRVSGYPYPFTLKTNATGETSFPGKVVDTGSSEVAVRFAGGGPLLGATEAGRIQVSQAGALTATGRSWAAAIAGALLVVAVASVLVGRWRRQQLREARRWITDAEQGLLAGNEYVATILTAYKRLTEHFVRYGYIARPDVTSHEFVAAARAALPVREGPLNDLVRLFDEARYSNHPIGPGERDAAVRALAAINRDLLAAGRSRRGGGGGGEVAA